MAMSPDLSVVIVSWNVADLLADCLDSLASQADGLALEAIVVDNASTDHTLTTLRERYGWVKVIANRDNVGFARANNQGFQHVTGRYVLILNPDTIVMDGALRKMIDFLETHPAVGMIGPRLIYPDGIVQPNCARRFNSLRQVLFCRALHLCEVPWIGSRLFQRRFFPYDYDVTQEVEAISGAAMLLRQEVLEQVGGFGETYIHSGEDMELCIRVRRAGWKTGYINEAVIIHLLGRSSEQVPVRTANNAAISVQEYFERCFGAHAGLVYRLIVQGIQVPVMLIVGVTKVVLQREPEGQFRRRWAMAKAIWHWRPM